MASSQLETTGMRANLRRRLPAAVLLALASIVAIFLWDHFSKPVVSYEFESYETVQELAGDADIVVAGMVGDTVAAFENRGDDPEFDEYGERIPGIETVVVEFVVGRTLKGDGVDQVLWVLRDDLDEVRTDDLTALSEGSEVVLFLTGVTRQRMPSLPQGYDEAWFIVGGDAGIFDIDGGELTHRLEGRLTGPSADDYELQVGDLEELEQLIQAGSG